MRPGPAVAATAESSSKPNARLAHGRGDDRVEALDMGARRDLRHDAAEGAMLVPLRAHDVGENRDPARAPSRSTTAAAVSSQLVSMPSTRVPGLLAASPGAFGAH